MKKENWNNIKMNVTFISKIGTKKDLIRELKRHGDYAEIKKLMENGEYYTSIGKIKNTYYWISVG